jgi:hypothetical protein
MDGDAASLEDICEEIEAAADLMNERLARIEKNTDTMTFWVRFMGIILLLSLIGTFVLFVSIQN